MNHSLARRQFLQEISQPDASIDLAKAALYLAQEDYPTLVVGEYLTQLDTFAAEVSNRLPDEHYPLKVIQTINQYLFGELGFAGDTDDYYDPQNSYLNRVLERRRGIPITLSLVYLEIARRIDFPMVGVGMPGHFLMRPTLDEMEVFVDAFHEGEVMFPEDCGDRLREVFGRPVELRPEFFQEVSPRQFLARMLTNLKMIYIRKGDLDHTLAAIERILLLFPEASLELRDRGLIYYEKGRWDEAIPDLTQYLTALPLAKDKVMIEQIINTMQRRQSDS